MRRVIATLGLLAVAGSLAACSKTPAALTGESIDNGVKTTLTPTSTGTPTPVPTITQVMTMPGPTKTVRVPVPAPTVTKTVLVKVATPAKTVTVTKSPSKVNVHPTPMAGNTIPGDGTYKVGADIQPGTYVAHAAASPFGSPLCYWARLSGSDPTGDIIVNDVVTAGQALVTIRPSDAYFSTSGCTTWHKR